MDVSLLFNSSLDFGRLIDATTSNVTGDLGITLLLIGLFLLLIAEIFKLPEVLYIVALIPIFIIFSAVDSSGVYSTILGIFAIVLAFYIGKTILFFK